MLKKKSAKNEGHTSSGWKKRTPAKNEISFGLEKVENKGTPKRSNKQQTNKTHTQKVELILGKTWGGGGGEDANGSGG